MTPGMTLRLTQPPEDSPTDPLKRNEIGTIIQLANSFRTRIISLSPRQLFFSYFSTFFAT